MGLLKCFLHNFETDDPEAWDRHCYYAGHTNTVWQNGEKVEEPYPRHHLREAIEGGLVLGVAKNGEDCYCDDEPED